MKSKIKHLIFVLVLGYQRSGICAEPIPTKGDRYKVDQNLQIPTLSCELRIGSIIEIIDAVEGVEIVQIVKASEDSSPHAEACVAGAIFSLDEASFRKTAPGFFESIKSLFGN